MFSVGCSRFFPSYSLHTIHCIDAYADLIDLPQRRHVAAGRHICLKVDTGSLHRATALGLSVEVRKHAAFVLAPPITSAKQILVTGGV
jgi:hypothetical protein